MIKIKVKNLLAKHINKILVFIAVLVMIIFGGIKYYLLSQKDKITKNNSIKVVNLEKSTTISKKKNNKSNNYKKEVKVFVDIKGAIVRPGVYEIEKGKRVIDVVYKAGGLSDEADTTLINLAKKIEDEMVVIIYTKDQIKEAKKKDLLSTTIKDSCVCPKVENDACLNNNSKNNTATKDTTKSQKETTTSNNKININISSKEELQNISGIGESKAEAIIKYREENGNFNKIDDILNVSGIGESLYEKIKDSITV